MKKKKAKGKIRANIVEYISIVSSISVIILSVVLFFLAKGYTLDFQNRTVKRRGAITVNVNATQNDIYIDGEMLRKPTRSKSVDSGAHNVKVEKKGYQTWEKNMRVLPETTTIAQPWLLLEKPKKATVWDSDRKYVRHWIDAEENIALLLLQEADETYTLWRYKLQKGVIDIFDNPTRIWTTSSDTFEMLLSPNGNFALLSITNNTNNQKKERYLINTSSQFTLESTQPLSITEKENTEIKWAEDSKHLLLISDQEILSYNINSEITYIILTKEEGKDYVWETDRNGNFYILKNLTKQDDEVYTYSIEKYGLDGTGETYLISNISMQKDEEYIKYYRTNLFSYVPFTNSVISTQTVGEIKSFKVNSNIQGVFITTTSASYWYDIASRIYIMVNPYPSEMLQFSNDNRHFLFVSNDTLYTFTFRKFAEDPLEKTGAIEFMNTQEGKNTRWVDNSRYYSYIKDGTLLVAEKDGENVMTIIPTESVLFYNIASSKETLTTFESNTEGTLFINEYKIL